MIVLAIFLNAFFGKTIFEYGILLIDFDCCCCCLSAAAVSFALAFACSSALIIIGLKESN
jgi:hypothetical protein